MSKFQLAAASINNWWMPETPALDFGSFQALMAWWQVSQEDALAYLGLQEPTHSSNLADYKDSRLPAPVRRKLAHFEQMYAALKLMREPDQFDYHWLHSPVHELRGNTPHENLLLFGTPGIRLVADYLVRQQLMQYLEHSPSSKLFAA